MDNPFLGYLARLFSGTDSEDTPIDRPMDISGINAYGTQGRFPLLRRFYRPVPQYPLPEDLRDLFPFWYHVHSEEELRDWIRREGLPLYTK